ncbi:hypothetical protein [Chelativorans sp. YIM 93263]|uniref:hypothetical protein n=2 Tax=Chelativorans sp. YIM 93263 TaxID=2906648 RepID=UPI0023793A1D|nr:hypothetical protein [Chelativorans sp. YIM 93263]
MAQSRSERLARQRERQRALRAATRARRRPTRDDIARALLHFAITENVRHGREEELGRLLDRIVTSLQEQGFDKREAETVLEDLVDKYRAGWSFQRKRHLFEDRGIDEDGAEA